MIAALGKIAIVDRHNSTISALNSGVNARRGRDRFFPTLSMMLDILPEPYRLLISDVRQNGAGPAG